jgi:hypothetical protein
VKRRDGYRKDEDAKGKTERDDGGKDNEDTKPPASAVAVVCLDLSLITKKL